MRFVPLALFALTLIASSSASAADVWSDPFPGIRRLNRTTSNQKINVLVVDLCAAGVSVRATASSEKGRTVGSFSALVGAQAAINGDFFASGYSTDGLAMHDGVLWPGEADHGYVGPIAFGDRRAALIPHEVMAGPEPWMREIVSGHPTLIAGGVVRDNNGDTGLCGGARHPRTAVGLSADKTKLYMAVVDGRATTRVGFTCDELAALMKEVGAHDALNLDGGGSTTMVIGGAVANNPSDGSQRVVGNHLAVFAKGTGDPTNCPIPRWSAKFTSASGWPGGTSMTVAPGTVVNGCLEYQNEGTETWSKGKTFLGTTKPRDRKSALAGADWVNDHRAASIDVDVPRGGKGKFCFSMKAPSTPGETTEYFGLVQEGVSWFGDSGGPADDANWLKVTVVEGPEAKDAGVIVPDASTAVDAAAPIEDTAVVDADDAAIDPADASPVDGSCNCSSPGASKTSAPIALVLATTLCRIRSSRSRSPRQTRCRPR